MRKIFIIAVLSAVLSVATIQSAKAQRLIDQPLIDTKNYMDTPYYNKMARDALRDRPARFNFFQFRALYSRTRQYDPIGNKAVNTINDLAYIVAHDEDPERVETALFAYQTEVSNHLAHIDVVLLALSLAREDKRFGQPKFFEWMRDGLINTVVISGDGNSLAGSYDVITLSEEVILFNRLGLKRLATQPVEEGIIYYNMHDVEDLQTKQTRTVFVNTSIPMRHLEEVKQKEQETFTLDIRKRQ